MKRGIWVFVVLGINVADNRVGSVAVAETLLDARKEAERQKKEKIIDDYRLCKHKLIKEKRYEKAVRKND